MNLEQPGRLRAFSLVLLFSVLLAACEERAGENARPESAATKIAVSQPESWDYVAIGGDFTYANGWAEVFADNLRADLGLSINFSDRSTHSSHSLERWLERLKEDEELRQELGLAEIVTFDVPLEAYLSAPYALYHGGFCRGEDGQECYQEAVGRVESDLTAFLSELTLLVDPSTTLIRTFSVGTLPAYTPSVEGWGPAPTEEETAVFAEYLRQIDEIILDVSAEYAIPAVKLSPKFQLNGPHSEPELEYFLTMGLSEEGNRAVAEMLREAGYEYSTTVSQ